LDTETQILLQQDTIERNGLPTDGLGSSRRDVRMIGTGSAKRRASRWISFESPHLFRLSSDLQLWNRTENQVPSGGNRPGTRFLLASGPDQVLRPCGRHARSPCGRRCGRELRARSSSALRTLSRTVAAILSAHSWSLRCSARSARTDLGGQRHGSQLIEVGRHDLRESRDGRCVVH